MPIHHLKNSKGFSLIEMLIAMAMAVVLLGATIYTFTKQEKMLREENAHVGIRNQGRLAMTALAEELREAGYGLPPGYALVGRPSIGVTAANTTTVTFRADLSNVNTMLAADAAVGTTTISVEDISTFADGDNIVLFDVSDPCHYEFSTISGTPAGNTITLGSVLTGQVACPTATTKDYAVSKGITIHKVDTVVYSYDAGAKMISRSINGGGAIPVIGNVTSFTMTYWDNNATQLTTLPLSAGDLGILRGIEVDVVVEDQTHPEWNQTFNTDINLRNMGI